VDAIPDGGRAGGADDQRGLFRNFGRHVYRRRAIHNRGASSGAVCKLSFAD
jgi:hypothetical protein